MKITRFSVVYNSFLSKITDDMYMELTPEDTLRDLSNILITSLPAFEFPRFNLYDYKIETKTILADSEEAVNGFAIQQIDNEIVVDNSHFTATLSEEEINILAILMMATWL